MKNLIIVTGGAGFVGSNLIEFFLKKTKFKIISIDNYSSGTSKNHFSSKRIKYIKRLLKRYKNTGELKVHLILNHLTVLFNVFGEAAVPLLFYNLEKDLWPYVKSFLLFLNRLPYYPKTAINNIKEDPDCLKQLKAI